MTEPRERPSDRGTTRTPGGARAHRKRSGPTTGLEMLPKQRQALLDWYSSGGGRTFPWRTRGSPYRYLVAELLLQRTRAENVVPVFLRLVERAPTLQHLARLRPSTLERIVRPLGLPTRAARISAAARTLVVRHGITAPRNATELLRLPGVGPYTHAAVAVFAWNEPRTLVDWTTQRVILRLSGARSTRRPVSDRRTARSAELMRGTSDPRSFNWALIDLAATHCRARPDCIGCPLRDCCATGRVLTTNRK